MACRLKQDVIRSQDDGAGAKRRLTPGGQHIQRTEAAAVISSRQRATRHERMVGDTVRRHAVCQVSCRTACDSLETGSDRGSLMRGAELRGWSLLFEAVLSSFSNLLGRGRGIACRLKQCVLMPQDDGAGADRIAKIDSWGIPHTLEQQQSSRADKEACATSGVSMTLSSVMLRTR